MADVDTTSSDYADFNAAVASAVAAYSGPGSYSLVGSTLTWTATADGQTADPLTISLGASDDATVEASEDYTISLSSPASTTGASVGLGATTAVTTTINDNDVATVSIAATTDADEAGLVNGVFTVTLTQSFQHRHGDQLHGGRFGQQRQRLHTAERHGHDPGRQHVGDDQRSGCRRQLGRRDRNAQRHA